MKRKATLFAIIMAILLTGASLVTAMTTATQESKSKETKQAKLQRQAKITIEQARETALQRAPGTVEDGELEREHGKLVYSFDIRNAEGTITEVQVNAITGKIARVEHENKRQEADEKHRDKMRQKP
jgi:uncharacterized membrane protein YkoI